MSLTDAISKALLVRDKLKKSGAANESNTRALLIDPLLAALGWDTGDLDVVEREIKVYDGTFLDYGLKVDEEPRVYVEAKAINENLTDKKFVAQTVNYANNDGVIWCVLTDGITWRVFKANESAAMDKKLLFEVDISDESRPAADRARQLRSISREAVITSDLDRYGERVFTDTRVRAALAALALDPPAPLTAAINGVLGHPPVPQDALQRSLARVWNAPASTSGVSATSTTATADGGAPSSGEVSPVGPPQPPKGQEYPLDHHLANKSALIGGLFNEVNEYGSARGADVSRRIRKLYVGYFRGKKSFFTVEMQRQRILVYLNLTVETATPWNDQTMRDASKVGHFGMGDIEYSLTSIDQLPEVAHLIDLAYTGLA